MTEHVLSRCGPCRVVFPHLSEIQAKGAAAGLVVVGISLEEDSPQMDTFVNRQKMDYTVAVSQQCGFPELPSYCPKLLIIPWGPCNFSPPSIHQPPRHARGQF